ncbi:MAG: DNA repair protein RecN [bacterium]|nr:DNA repair protein RecN [bacterium]
MLSTLKLTNYILIDNLEIDFTNGMTVLTGETGSGKSLLIGALNILQGSLTDKSVVKKGKDICELTAIFNDPITKTETFITRKISNEGKNKCYLNGMLVPLKTIRETMDRLINIHGQNTNQFIFKQKEQIKIIDHYAGSSQERETYNTLSIKLKNSQIDLEKLKKDRLDLKEQQDFLKFKKEELVKLNLKENEYEKLKKKYQYLANLDQVKYDITEVSEATATIGINISRIIKSLEKLPNLENYLKEIQTADNLFSELARETTEAKESIKLSTSDIDQVAERLEKIKRIQKKYQMTNNEIVAYLNKISGLLRNIDDETEAEFNIQDKIKLLEKKLEVIAIKLVTKRKLGAKKLENAINRNFTDLCMNKVSFKVKIQGLLIKFLIRTNAGQDYTPIENIVSGGELSRIMLALKSVITSFDKTPTLIFDEIDTGIGGKIAFIVGKKLKSISKNHQILCITHLAQVAVFGDTHQIVIKTTNSEATKIKVQNANDPTKEIARMLGGEEITQTAIDHAKDLIEKSSIS